MLFVHARTNLVVVRLHAIFLALTIAAGLAFVTINPGRGEESPAYAIEVSDVTAKVGERAVMQAKLRIRDGYRILQSYNNRVIKLSAEDDGVAFEQEMVRARIEEGVLVFAVPLRATKPGRHPVNGVFRVGYIHDSDEMAMVSLRLIASVTGTQ
jgi:predicted N-formylglutamate amidohydrolase